MSHLSWSAALKAGFDHHCRPSTIGQSPEAARAEQWLSAMKALLDRCPEEVTDAMPEHADNLTLMQDALSDLRGDVRGFYERKGEI